MFKSRKRIFLVLGLTVLLAIAALIAPIAMRMPSPQGTRVMSGELVGVDAAGSFAWIIPTKTGVVLVDSGWDYDGQALKEEVNNRKVHAILLTHAHFDHVAGLPLFPEATVYVGPEETPLLIGEVEAGGWMARMMAKMLNSPSYTPSHLKEIRDGEVLEIDGEQIQAIHVPGHTHGSTMYIWKDILFSGDTIVGRGGYVNEIPKPTYDDYHAVKTSVAKLISHKFNQIADGHVGFHENAYDQVKTYVDKNQK